MIRQRTPRNIVQLKLAWLRCSLKTIPAKFFRWNTRDIAQQTTFVTREFRGFLVRSRLTEVDTLLAVHTLNRYTSSQWLTRPSDNPELHAMHAGSPPVTACICMLLPWCCMLNTYINSLLTRGTVCFSSWCKIMGVNSRVIIGTDRTRRKK